MYEDKKTFWQKKGFYFSLCGALICVLAVGTVYYKMNAAKKGGGETLFADSAADKNADNNSVAGGSAVSSNNDDGQQVAEVNPNEEDKSDSDVKNGDDLEDDDKDDLAVISNEQIKATAKPQEKKSKEKTDKKDTANSKQEKKKPSQDSVATMADSRDLKFDAEKGLLWPVKGDILLKYSTNNTVYFKTLAQYRCNPAIIIGAETGKKVKSAADGVVTKISEEFDIGKAVTMNIGSGYSVTYGQLRDINVKEGQSVKEGDVIGKIAEPTKYYSQEGSNLYFQVKENKETVDPMLLLR